MNLGLLIYGSLDTLSGGYLYDRKLVGYLRSQGDTVEVSSLPWRSYPAHLADNLNFRLPRGPALLIQDELNHPSVLVANAKPHPYPVISLVHHLRSSEQRAGWQNYFYRLLEQRYLNSVDGLIYNSETTRREVERLLREPKPSIVAYPPTDRFGLQVTRPQVIERAWIPEMRLLFLGNVIRRKGLHTLLEALKSLPAQIRLDVVGSLETEPVYARAMQEKANGLAVTFHSSLDKEPLIRLFRSAHVLVIPSSYEGFGIAYLEGMGFGLPAIGTGLGAAREIISDGVDGFILPPGDSRTLADRLGLLAGDRALLISMSLAARRRYLRQPSWISSAASIRNFLQEML
jgi:glycosyltransferase involved in cell wall biosynthesis